METQAPKKVVERTLRIARRVAVFYELGGLLEELDNLETYGYDTGKED